MAGESLNDYETLRMRKDGTWSPCRSRPRRSGTRPASVVSNMVAYTDITERKAQDAEVHRLNAELHARLEDLAASRARIVAAGDVERRRLERNLHDGAQQRLSPSRWRCDSRSPSSSPTRSPRARSFEEAGDELAVALEELRELARGLHPAVLGDRGLRAAVEMLPDGRRAWRSPNPGRTDGEPVEAAAYYLIAKALTNVTKYARRRWPGQRHVERRRRHRRGVRRRRRRSRPVRRVGLRGLADRVEALGGALRVDSPAGGGTSLRAEIPST